MPNSINETDWLVEQDIPAAGGQPDMGAGGPPMGQPGGPGDPMGQDMAPPPATDMATDPGMEDISGDPQFPDMPEETETDDFEIWKIKYVKESIKGDPNQLTDMILSVRDQDLEPSQRKFVEDNLQINLLRQNANIFEASTEIRKLIKKDFDRTFPSTSVINHIVAVMEQNPMLNEVYLKFLGLGGAKGDLHRKFIGSLMGAVQVGSGASNEDLIFEEVDYSIRVSTRFNTKWGDVNIGRWFLKDDDPERYLKDAELARLEGGSPEEKDVLRRRVVIESIAENYRERAFIINVVGTDGSVYHLGWDLGTSLKNAFLDGKLVVRTSDSDKKEAFIDEEGAIVPIPNMSIYYVKESSQLMNSGGKPEIEEVEFMNHRDGMLYLTANLDLLKEASIAMQGMVLKDSIWQGVPTDIFRITRCVPSSPEMLLRQC